MTNNKPLLSIIVPFYNVKPYISCFFDSINEEWSESIELICVEDGSTDGTDKILKDHLQLFYDSGKTNIHLIEHSSNMGLAEARNSGLKKANGEYVWFLDSDDVIKKGAISYIINIINSSKHEIIFFNFDVLFSERGCPRGNDGSFDTQLAIHKKSFQKIETLNKEDRVEAYIDNNKFFAWMFVCNISLYKRIDFKFPFGKYFEDISSIPLLVWYADSVKYYEKEIIYYRQRPSSIIGKITVRNRLDLSEAFDNVSMFFKNEKTSKSLQNVIDLYRFDLIRISFWDLYLEKLLTDTLSLKMYHKLKLWKSETGLGIKDLFSISLKKDNFRQAIMRVLFFIAPKTYFYMQNMKALGVLFSCRIIDMQRCKYYRQRFKS